MGWITLSLLSTLFAGFFPTFLKISQNYYQGDSIMPIIFFMNFILNEVYNLITGVTHQLNKLALFTGLIHGLTIYFFNKAVETSNNPALPAANERLQVLLTYFISVVVFKTKISIEKVISIITIIIGAFITVLGNYKRTSDLTWVKYSFGAILGQSLTDITAKKAMTTTTLGNYLSQDLIVAAAISLFLQYKTTKQLGLQKIKDKNKSKINLINKYPILSLAIAIIAQSLLITFMAAAIKKAPNAAYPKAIFGLTGLLILIMSYLFESKASISKQEIIGNIIIVLGVIGTSIL